MAAFVRISGPPNGNFLFGYPGITSTFPRIEGKVEIRPSIGIDKPVTVSLVTISLQRVETIHPNAESITKKHLATPRKETRDIIGNEMLLYRCPAGKATEQVMAMDLPFIIFVPVGRADEVSRKVPAASLRLNNARTAETYYELVCTVEQGAGTETRHPQPVPLTRHDTLSSFGMYDRPQMKEAHSDHTVRLEVSLARWAYGPLDPINVFVKLSPNPDWAARARKVAVKTLTIAIEEVVTYNHEGDEPQRKAKTIAKQTQAVNGKLPDQGLLTSMGLVFPSRDLRNDEGIIPAAKLPMPMYEVAGFTTVSRLYRIEYFLTVKAVLSSAKDVELKQPITVCPVDYVTSKRDMEIIKQCSVDMIGYDPNNPMLPAYSIVRPNDPAALTILGLTKVGGRRKLLIE